MENPRPAPDRPDEKCPLAGAIIHFLSANGGETVHPRVPVREKQCVQNTRGNLQNVP